MAKGYPDFFGVPQWPMLGGATTESAEDTVPFGEDLWLLTVEDKGQLYYVRVYLEDNDSVFDCLVQVVLDDTVIPYEVFTKGVVKRNLANVPFAQFATVLDYTNNKIEVAVIGPLPFTENAKVLVVNNGTQDITAHVDLCYAAVSGGVVPT